MVQRGGERLLLTAMLTVDAPHSMLGQSLFSASWGSLRGPARSESAVPAVLALWISPGPPAEPACLGNGGLPS
uniref:Uncharacterized protein n=1 Tax=Anguilla anguilla TaxID=7936 RepID=A0A0E9TNT2_ANGAN